MDTHDWTLSIRYKNNTLQHLLYILGGLIKYADVILEHIIEFAPILNDRHICSSNTISEWCAEINCARITILHTQNTWFNFFIRDFFEPYVPTMIILTWNLELRWQCLWRGPPAWAGASSPCRSWRRASAAPWAGSGVPPATYNHDRWLLRSKTGMV